MTYTLVNLPVPETVTANSKKNQIKVNEHKVVIENDMHVQCLETDYLPLSV